MTLHQTSGVTIEFVDFKVLRYFPRISALPFLDRNVVKISVINNFSNLRNSVLISMFFAMMVGNYVENYFYIFSNRHVFYVV